MERILKTERKWFDSGEMKVYLNFKECKNGKFTFSSGQLTITIDQSNVDNYHIVATAHLYMKFEKDELLGFLFNGHTVNIIERHLCRDMFFTVGTTDYYILRNAIGYTVLRKPTGLKKKLTANILERYFLMQFKKYSEHREDPMLKHARTFYI